MKIFIPYEITDIEARATVILKEENHAVTITGAALSIIGKKESEHSDSDDDDMIDDVAQYVQINVEELDPMHRIALADSLQELAEQMRNITVQ